MVKVLFVCMGNICRSPTAEAVFRKVLQTRRLEERVEVSSAGTHGYHVGAPPDRRAQEAAARRGYNLSKIRARKVSPQDLDYFDLILCMDKQTLESLREICPAERSSRLGLFMDFSSTFPGAEVPDPYYGQGEGFDLVLDMVEDATHGLAERIKHDPESLRWR